MTAPTTPDPLAPEPPGERAGPPLELDADRELDDLVFGPGDHGGADLDHTQLTRCALRSVQLTGASLRGVTWRDVSLADCELSGAMFTSASLIRVEVVGARASGAVVADGTLVHVRFVECKLDGANFRTAGLEQCVFERCNLVDADFADSRLRTVAFDRCDLTRADFSGIACEHVSLHHSTVDDLRGVASLRGAVATPEQVLPLALGAFRSLGILVDDAD